MNMTKTNSTLMKQRTFFLLLYSHSTWLNVQKKILTMIRLKVTKVIHTRLKTFYAITDRIRVDFFFLYFAFPLAVRMYPSRVYSVEFLLVIWLLLLQVQ